MKFMSLLLLLPFSWMGQMKIMVSAFHRPLLPSKMTSSLRSNPTNVVCFIKQQQQQHKQQQQKQQLQKIFNNNYSYKNMATLLCASSLSNNNDNNDNSQQPVDPLVQSTSKLLNRLAWGSWWAQVILTVVSSVTLIFARNVMQASGPTKGAAGYFFFAGSGIMVSFASIVWTWACQRLARRLVSSKPTTGRIKAAKMIRKQISIGLSINVIGMLLTLIGAEQIVGGLAIKVLTTTNNRQAFVLDNGGGGGSLLQPLDILVVQANTNTLLSHFCSLVSLLYLIQSVLKLDPPSKDRP